MAAKPSRAPRARKTGAPKAEPQVVPDGFYRDMVWNLRNGVVAVTRDGRVAVMNDIAYRILGLKPRAKDIGRHFSEVLKDAPDVLRMVASAFDLSHLPNRAEMRLKHTGKVIGYTLSHVKDDAGRDVGATLFFKDLTRVEQLEERERLRDRLAALGEMAAAIAHEVKNPLAGIEVMAGILKRQLTESPDAQNILADIIKEAKMANAIVVEVLEALRHQGGDYHALRTRVAGAKSFVDVHVLLPGSMTIQAGHDLVERLENEIQTRLPHVEVLTHLEPLEDPKSWDDPQKPLAGS